MVDIYTNEACDNKSSLYRTGKMQSDSNLLKRMRDKNRSSKLFGHRNIRPTESKNKYDGAINTRFSNTKFGKMLRSYVAKKA